jgi:hypothetical protein
VFGDFGRYRHAHRLVSTYTTAVNTDRSSTGAVPPPCGREPPGQLLEQPALAGQLQPSAWARPTNSSMSRPLTAFAGCGSTALTYSSSITLSLVIDASSLIRSYTDRFTVPTKVTKGAGSRAAGLAMVFKLVESAQAWWRAVNGAHMVALVRAGACFERGLLVERAEALAA